MPQLKATKRPHQTAFSQFDSFLTTSHQLHFPYQENVSLEGHKDLTHPQLQQIILSHPVLSFHHSIILSHPVKWEGTANVIRQPNKLSLFSLWSKRMAPDCCICFQGGKKFFVQLNHMFTTNWPSNDLDQFYHLAMHMTVTIILSLCGQF